MCVVPSFENSSPPGDVGEMVFITISHGGHIGLNLAMSLERVCRPIRAVVLFDFISSAPRQNSSHWEAYAASRDRDDACTSCRGRKLAFARCGCLHELVPLVAYTRTLQQVTTCDF